MQLRSAVLAACFVAASSVVVVGCGEDGGPGGETACTDNSSCGENQICHPFAKICVQSCSSAADCPDTAKECGTIDLGDGTQSEQFCQCQTDELCGGGVGSSTVCSSSQDQICTVQCGEGTCGEGRECNEQGHCVNSTNGGGNGQVGDACENNVTEEPTSCSYGLFCSGDEPTGECTAVTPPDQLACNNFPAGSPALDWDPATSTGPVIYEISTQNVTEDEQAVCGGGTRHQILIRAYRPTGTWTEDDAALEAEFNYVNVSGNEVNTTNTVTDLQVSNDGRNVAFIFNLCDQSSTPLGQVTLGVYFDGGNPVCHVSDNPARLLPVDGYSTYPAAQ